MSHYFENDQKLTEGSRVVSFELGGRKFAVETQNGVFSKKRLDYGTEVMLQAILADVHDATGTWLDLGCGAGYVTIALASLLPETTWTMVDINQRAVALAKKNVAKILPMRRISVICGDGLSAIDKTIRYSSIVINPPFRAGKLVVHQLMLDAFACLQNNGTLYYVGQRKQGIDSLTAWLCDNCNIKVTILAKSAGFHVYKATKYDC